MLLQQHENDPARMQRVLAGLQAYQQASRPPRMTPMPEHARAGRACLRDYGGTGRTVVFVPSLINPPSVLDLAADNSLLRWLARQGVRPMLLDWGDPRDGQPELSVAGHVENLLLPLLKQVDADAALAGYCLGGTMAIAAAALKPPAALLLIATPWNFNGYSPEALQHFDTLWRAERPVAERLQLFPMEMLQSAFWQLDPEKTLSKYAAFADFPLDSDKARGFIALEDWANEGTPLTLAAARELFEDMFAANRPGSGHWNVGGETIDPAQIRCPALNITSSTDRIVPAGAAPHIGTERMLDQGHVGMIVGRRAQASLWGPVSQWLSQLRHS